MRRPLRWLTNLVCVVCLLLGLACLIAWPVSYWREVGALYERMLYVTEPTELDHLFHGYIFEGCITRGRFRCRYVNSRVSGYEVSQDQIISVDVDRHFSYRIVVSEDVGTDNPWFKISQGNPGMTHTEIHANIPLPLIAALLLIPITIRELFLLSRRLRRRHRLQSGLCLHCGYNLHGVTSDTCPECGQARAMVTVQAD